MLRSMLFSPFIFLKTYKKISDKSTLCVCVVRLKQKRDKTSYLTHLEENKEVSKYFSLVLAYLKFTGYSVFKSECIYNHFI